MSHISLKSKRSKICLWPLLSSGKDQKRIVACTCLSKIINSANWTESSNSPDWKPESTWTAQHLAWILVSRTNVFFRGEPKAKNDTKGSFSCRSAAGCTRDCNADRLPQITCSPNPTRNAFKEHLLEWASAKHGLSCIILGPINHSLVSSNGIRMWIEKHCWHRKTLRKWKGAFPALAFFQGHRMRKARYVVARPMDALVPIA